MPKTCVLWYQFAQISFYCSFWRPKIRTKLISFSSIRLYMANPSKLHTQTHMNQWNQYIYIYIYIFSYSKFALLMKCLALLMIPKQQRTFYTFSAAKQDWFLIINQKKKKQQFGLVELSCQNLDSQTIIFRQSIKRLNIFLGKQTERKKIWNIEFVLGIVWFPGVTWSEISPESRVGGSARGARGLHSALLSQFSLYSLVFTLYQLKKKTTVIFGVISEMPLTEWPSETVI